MILQIECFAGARDANDGCDFVRVEVDAGATAGEVLRAIAQQHPPLADLASRSRLAADDAYVDANAVMKADQKLALIPPVSGG